MDFEKYNISHCQNDDTVKKKKRSFIYCFIRLFKINSTFNVTWKFKTHEGGRKKINKQKFQTAMYLMKYTGSLNITWTLWNSTHCKFIPSQFLRFPSRDFFLNLGLYPFWEHIMQTGWAEEWLAMTSSGMSIGFWFPQTKHTKGKLFLLWK